MFINFSHYVTQIKSANKIVYKNVLIDYIFKNTMNYNLSAIIIYSSNHFSILNRLTSFSTVHALSMFLKILF